MVETIKTISPKPPLAKDIQVGILPEETNKFNSFTPKQGNRHLAVFFVLVAIGLKIMLSVLKYPCLHLFGLKQLTMKHPC